MAYKSLFFALWLFLAVPQSIASVLYVSPMGDDTSAGTSELPFRSIQAAVEKAFPGDTVIVKPGDYEERVTTVRAGTGETNRITLAAEGSVVVRGFLVRHRYISIQGFEISGHSAQNAFEAHVEVTSNGDFLMFNGNTVRDGIYYVGSEVSFHDNGASGDTITSPTGGFLAAGFKAGQTIRIDRASAEALLNTGTRVIQSVNDDTITVLGTLSPDGPKSAYISGSYAYGLVVLGGAENCLFRGNVFTNLSFDTWLISGMGHTLESNRVEYTHGWDVMHFMGTNLVFRGNYFKRSPLVVYQVSPDVFENWPSTYANVLFENNFVEAIEGVLGSQKRGPTLDSRDLTFRNNVFIDVGAFTTIYTNTSFINNTFLRVASSSNPVTSPTRHAINFVFPSAANPVAKNNIFVGCGEGRDFDLQGWFEFNGPPSTASFAANFVSGGPPEFSPKSGYVVAPPLLNGGDPGFVNIDDPVGPDGIPFTEDDGLRLRADSKLRGAGEFGMDLGAYATAGAPTLVVTRLEDGGLQLSWPASLSGYALEAASSPVGDWSAETTAPVQIGEVNVVDIVAASTGMFYRLKDSGAGE